MGVSMRMSLEEMSIVFLKRFSLMWTVFKVFIEFFTILLPFHVLVFWP